MHRLSWSSSSSRSSVGASATSSSLVAFSKDDDCWTRQRKLSLNRRRSSSSSRASSCSFRSGGSLPPYGPQIALLDYIEEVERENDSKRANKVWSPETSSRTACVKYKKNVAIRIQAWWRCRASMKRLQSLLRITEPWRALLKPNEGVVYGSVCIHLPGHNQTASWLTKASSRQVFLLLTTSSRLLLCDPVSKKLLEQVHLNRQETTTCDLGNQTFVVSSVPSSNNSFSFALRDLLSSSMTWVSTLRELPSVMDLNRICRKNSLRASNFPIRMMGALRVHSSSTMARVLGLHDQRLAVVIGTKLVMLNSKISSDYDFVELDTFTSVETTHNGFLIRSVNGECLRCRCSNEADRDRWVAAVTNVVSSVTVGFMRLGQRRLSLRHHTSSSQV